MKALLGLQKQAVYSHPLPKALGTFGCLSSTNLYRPLETVTSVLSSTVSCPSPDKLGTAAIKTETSYIIRKDILGVTHCGERGFLIRGNKGTAACLRTRCRGLDTQERRSCIYTK